MVQKLPALALALCLVCLAAGRAHADPLADLEPYSVATNHPNGIQLWYVANTNPQRYIRVRIAAFENGHRMRDLTFAINPGDSVFVGTTDLTHQRSWQIVRARYQYP